MAGTGDDEGRPERDARRRADDRVGPESWEDVEQRRRRSVRLRIGLLAGAVLLCAAAILLATLEATEGPPGTDARREITAPPATDDTSPAARGSGSATQPLDVGGGSSATTATPGAPGEDGGAPAKTAPLIAYRLTGEVWVARVGVRGAAEQRVVANGGVDEYSLSPDGRTLAMVDASATLWLTEVAGGDRVRVGAASAAQPVWSPDSTRLAYVRVAAHAHEIREVSRDGTGDRPLGQGMWPAYSPDGSAIAWADTSGPHPGGRTYLWLRLRGAPARRLETTGPPSAVALAADRVYYATHQIAGAGTAGREGAGGSGIWSMRYEGRDLRRVVGAPSGTRPFGYAGLCLSPDRRWLVFAEVGDDMYSRTYAAGTDGSRKTGFSIRHDTYPACWSLDSQRVYFFEGNWFQGEPTRLMSARVDGTDRRVVVEGARP